MKQGCYTFPVIRHFTQNADIVGAKIALEFMSISTMDGNSIRLEEQSSERHTGAIQTPISLHTILKLGPYGTAIGT